MNRHRLGYGLLGSLIPIAPHTFAPQRQMNTRELPSPWMFQPGSTDFIGTLAIPFSSYSLKAVG